MAFRSNSPIPLYLRQQAVPPRGQGGVAIPPALSPTSYVRRVSSQPYVNIAGQARKRNWWAECRSQAARGVPAGANRGQYGEIFRRHWGAVADDYPNMYDADQCEEALRRYNAETGLNVQINRLSDYFTTEEISAARPRQRSPQRSLMVPPPGYTHPGAQAVPPRNPSYSRPQAGSYDAAYYNRLTPTPSRPVTPPSYSYPSTGSYDPAYYNRLSPTSSLPSTSSYPTQYNPFMPDYGDSPRGPLVNF